MKTLESNKMASTCLRFLPGVMQAALAKPNNPGGLLLEIFEDYLQQAEQQARDSHALFDPGAFHSAREASPRSPSRSARASTGGKTVSVDWEREWVNWLAGWVLMDEWTAASAGDPIHSSRTRSSGSGSVPGLIENACTLYRLRGTAQGLVASVQVICGLDVKVIEHTHPRGLRIGSGSTIGVNSWLMPEVTPIEHFTVLLPSSSANAEALPMIREVATSTASRSVTPLPASPGVRGAWIWGPTLSSLSPLFVTADIKDGPKLIERLVERSDPISAFLWNLFSGRRQQVLRDPGVEPALKISSLVEELNNVVRGPSIYDSRLFVPENLSTRTFALVSKPLDAAGILRLNRMLLEDAYPAEIAPSEFRDVDDIVSNSRGAASAEAGEFSSVVHRLRTVIEKEKPAHTSFYLAVEAPAPSIVPGDEPWMRIGMRDYGVRGLFAAPDLRDPVSLARKLSQHTEPMARHLWELIGQPAQHIIGNPNTPAAQLLPVLLEELNRLLRGRGIFVPGRLDRTQFSRRAEAIYSQNPEGDELVRLNRLVLEEAFPAEFVRRPDVPSSVISRFSIK
jgi:hypothetical protein